jgi:hypothetical protein
MAKKIVFYRHNLGDRSRNKKTTVEICLNCDREFNSMGTSSFCHTRCKKDWTEKHKLTGVMVRINDKTVIMVKDVERIDEVRAKWVNRLGKGLTTQIITPIKK